MKFFEPTADDEKEDGVHHEIHRPLKFYKSCKARPQARQEEKRIVPRFVPYQKQQDRRAVKIQHCKIPIGDGAVKNEKV